VKLVKSNGKIPLGGPRFLQDGVFRNIAIFFRAQALINSRIADAARAYEMLSTRIGFGRPKRAMESVREQRKLSIFFEHYIFENQGGLSF
jgi:hypothetical protein